MTEGLGTGDGVPDAEDTTVGVGVGSDTGGGVEDGVGADVGCGAAQPMAKAQIRTAANGFMSPPTDSVSAMKGTMRGPVWFR